MLRRFLRQPANSLVIAVCIALAIALVSISLSATFPFNATRNSSNAISSIEQTGTDTDRRDEASEYWSILGHRLKITDTLLVIFTFTLWWATRDLVIGAKDTTQRQLRAYVFLDKINLVPRKSPTSNNLQWNIDIAWKNFGGTRTRNLIAKVSDKVLDLSHQPVEGFNFQDEEGAEVFHGLIGPSQSVNQPPIQISDVQLGGGNGNDTALLIWGWAEYRDVFSSTIRRTEFGFRVHVEGVLGRNSIIHFEPTEKHNAADEDCLRPIQSAASHFK
jgi:hypothetical protein